MNQGKYNGRGANGAQRQAATVAMALQVVQAQRHRSALFAAAADYLERDFTPSDVGPARYRVLGPCGLVESAREDVVSDLAGEFRRRAAAEREGAIRVLGMVLSAGQLEAAPQGIEAGSSSPEARAELNPETQSRSTGY